MAMEWVAGDSLAGLLRQGDSLVALDLRIAGSTVLTYRKRAYQRLDVASPVELCALIAH